MKKTIAILAVLSLTASMVTGCAASAAQSSGNTSATANSSATAVTNAADTPTKSKEFSAYSGLTTNGSYYDGTPIKAEIEGAPELHITIPPATLETKVWFPNPTNGETICGILRFPLNFERTSRGAESKKYPAIVFNGPIGSVKEQTQSTYAKYMSDLGYVTLVFDDSTFGESTGEPRNIEAADIKVSDIKAAVDYLLTLNYVDPERIGGIGICGGGGFMMYAASQDRRIKAYAGIVPFGMIADPKAEPTGGGMGGFGGNTEEMEKQKAAYERGEIKADYSRGGIRPGSLESAYYLDPRRGYGNYYKNIGSLSWSSLYSKEFDLQKGIENLAPTPMLVIAPEQHLMPTAENAFATYPDDKGYKEYHIIPKSSHYEVYDLEPWVGMTVGWLKDFFAKQMPEAKTATSETTTAPVTNNG